MSEAAIPTRIKPVYGHDNKWWWDQVQQDVMPIQRCSQCNTLRHPPRPMCHQCHSLDWDFTRASGEGTVCSFTNLHYPEFPGYQYPLIIVLVDLVEGTRITSQLVDCDPDEVEFGMAVQMHIHEDDDGFKLPVFERVS